MPEKAGSGIYGTSRHRAGSRRVEPGPVPPGLFRTASSPGPASWGTSWGIRINGEWLMTPAGNPVSSRDRELAERVAMEWQRAPAQVTAGDIPLSRLVAGACDGLFTPENLAARLATDTVLFRGPDRQLAAWQERMSADLLDWFRGCFGVSPSVTESLASPRPSSCGSGLFRDGLARYPPLGLAFCGIAGDICGSVIVATGLLSGVLPVDTAFRIAFSEEIFQAARWGAVPAAEARRRRICGELQGLVALVDLPGFRPA